MKIAVLSCILLLSTLLPLAAETPAALCDGSTALTPIGMDTESGRVLLAVPPLGDAAAGWIVELAAGSGEMTATAYPDAGGGRFGGSVGPGPVIAVQPCGPTCQQPVRFQAGTWEKVGEPVAVPVVITTAATYDESGAPWLVVHGTGPAEGEFKAWAYRYEEREWRAKGTLVVTAVGDVAAVPAPGRRDAVLSGTGRFAAGGAPDVWAAGLPDVPAERRGGVVALAGGATAYLAADNAVYLSGDAGRTWRRSVWTPWGGGTAGATEIRKQGKDFWLDLPWGDRRGALEPVWFDHRAAGEEALFLSRWTGGEWTVLARGQDTLRTRNDVLEVSHVLAPRPGSLLILSGCVATDAGSGLVVRSYAKGALSDPRIVPIVSPASPAPAAPARP